MAQRYEIFLRPDSPVSLDADQLLAHVASLPEVTVEPPSRWLLRRGGREVLIEQAVVDGAVRGLDCSIRFGDGDPELLCDTVFALGAQVQLLAFDPQLGRSVLPGDRQAVAACFDRQNAWILNTVGPTEPLPGNVPYPELRPVGRSSASRALLIAALALLALLALLGLCSRLATGWS